MVGGVGQGLGIEREGCLQLGRETDDRYRGIMSGEFKVERERELRGVVRGKGREGEREIGGRRDLRLREG